MTEMTEGNGRRDFGDEDTGVPFFPSLRRGAERSEEGRA